MIDESHPLLLASASPRRREILETLRLPLAVAAAAADESTRPGEPASRYLERVVLAKLEAAAALPRARGAGAVLVADTSVLVDGDILGKPGDDADATTMLRRIAGRQHEVWTRFAIARGDAPRAPAHSETVRTRVRVRPLDDAAIAAYVATGEGRDKAGSYAIQGIFSFAVDGIDGSYTNVVGLPACEVIAALRALGLLASFPLAPRSP